MTIVPDNSGFMTSFGVGAISVVGALTKGTQWRDAKTGKMVWSLLTSGVATCLIMASIIRAAGVHFNIEPWAQVMFSGVFCYVGPDPIIRAVAGMALKKIGVEANVDGNNATKP